MLLACCKRAADATKRGCIQPFRTPLQRKRLAKALMTDGQKGACAYSRAPHTAGARELLGKAPGQISTAQQHHVTARRLHDAWEAV